ncbi:MAG: hypothetical protein JW725_02800 [Candidatus Babeliaceae bacterium]|nr:hypothetical protein [Candidatus Babeliaceae bacterium]
MQLHFSAATGKAEHDFQGTDGEVVIAGVIGEQGHYLLFQRYTNKKHPDDDGIYVEYNDQLYAGTDCISVCKVSKCKLEISLSSPLYALPDVTGFDIQLDLNDMQYQHVIEALKDIFREQKEKLMLLS